MKRDDTVYVRHMLDAIQRVGDYVAGMDKRTFSTRVLVQDAVIRQLEVIGEAARHVSPDLRRGYPEIPWDDMTGMRDKLIHGYFGVDIEKVWLTAIEDLPVLRDQLSEIVDK